MNNLREAQEAMKKRWSRGKRKGPKVGSRHAVKLPTVVEVQRRRLDEMEKLIVCQTLCSRGNWTLQQLADLVHLPLEKIEYWLTPVDGEKWLSFQQWRASRAGITKS